MHREKYEGDFCFYYRTTKEHLCCYWDTLDIGESFDVILIGSKNQADVLVIA